MLTPHIKMVSLSNPSKIRAAPPVVNVCFHNLYPVVLCVLHEHLFLARYGIAFPVRDAVINRQSCVQPCFWCCFICSPTHWLLLFRKKLVNCKVVLRVLLYPHSPIPASIFPLCLNLILPSQTHPAVYVCCQTPLSLPVLSYSNDIPPQNQIFMRLALQGQMPCRE